MKLISALEIKAIIKLSCNFASSINLELILYQIFNIRSYPPTYIDINIIINLPDEKILYISDIEER